MRKTPIIFATLILAGSLTACSTPAEAPETAPTQETVVEETTTAPEEPEESAEPVGTDEDAYLEDFKQMLVTPEIVDEENEEVWLQWGTDHCNSIEAGLTREMLEPTYESMFANEEHFVENAAVIFMDAAETHLC